MSDLTSGQDSIAFSPGQLVITSFAADKDLVSLCPVPSDNYQAKRPPRHWIVYDVGAGTKSLQYVDHWGNTITLDCTNLQGVLLPAGKTIKTGASTSIAGIFVIY